MHSPLPDSSALEAGILADENPPCASRVQDNVRNLLRNSVLSSIRGSAFILPARSACHPNQRGSGPIVPSPLRPHHQLEPEVLPSPSSDTTTSDSTSTGSSTAEQNHIPGVLFPPINYTNAVQQMAHQSTLFNTRAVAALDHPDLSDPSLAVFLQQKSESRQQRAWKRSRNGGSSRHHHRRSKKRSGSQWWLCLISALLLAAIVATCMDLPHFLRADSCANVITDLALATTQKSLSPTFHILFILGILFATIVFAHTVIRMCLFNRGLAGSAPFLIVPPPRYGSRGHRRHHHRHHRRPQILERPKSLDCDEEYVPSVPIPVCVPPEDEVRPDSREAQPTGGTTRPADGWDKDVEALPNPPPAYGRWRGSVRANPDLLHWAPSPTIPRTPSLPSPTYEEAMQGASTGNAGPPSYKTKESPARLIVVEESGESATPAPAAEPEMVEGRGIGIAQ